MLQSKLTVLLLLSIGGCATNPANQGKPLAEADNKVCVREYRTGSNLPTTTCEAPKTEEERLREAEEIRNSIRSIPRQAPNGAGG